MKILVKDGKAIKLAGGGVILPIETPAELKSCTITVTSNDYTNNIYCDIITMSTDRKIIYQYDITIQVPFEFQSIQNQMCVFHVRNPFTGIPAFNHIVNMEYEYGSNLNLYMIPTSETCSFNIYNAND